VAFLDPINGLRLAGNLDREQCSYCELLAILRSSFQRYFLHRLATQSCHRPDRGLDKDYLENSAMYPTSAGMRRRSSSKTGTQSGANKNANLPQPYRLLTLQPSGRLNRRSIRGLLLLLLGLATVLLIRIVFKTSLESANREEAAASTYSRAKDRLKQTFFSPAVPATPVHVPNTEEAARVARNIARTLLPPRTGGPIQQWEEERLDDLARAIACKMMDNCTAKQKKVVISTVGRWKWSLDSTFDRPASFPNGEAGEPAC
jgi:hypothetical protein